MATIYNHPGFLLDIICKFTYKYTYDTIPNTNLPDEYHSHR